MINFQSLPILLLDWFFRDPRRVSFPSFPQRGAERTGVVHVVVVQVNWGLLLLLMVVMMMMMIIIIKASGLMPPSGATSVTSKCRWTRHLFDPNLIPPKIWHRFDPNLYLHQDYHGDHQDPTIIMIIKRKLTVWSKVCKLLPGWLWARAVSPLKRFENSFLFRILSSYHGDDEKGTPPEKNNVFFGQSLGPLD